MNICITCSKEFKEEDYQYIKRWYGSCYASKNCYTCEERRMMSKIKFSKTSNGCTFIGTEYTPEELKIIKRKSLIIHIKNTIVDFFKAILVILSLFSLLYWVVKVVRMAWYD